MSAGIEHLAEKEFSGGVDGWTKTLCLELSSGGGCILSSCSHKVVAYVYDLPTNEDGEWQILDTIQGKQVWRDGDFLVSELLTPHSDDSVAEFAHGEAEDALTWLAEYGWRRVKEWPDIERRVRGVLGS
jgi:hypothetical protein